jgi:hypothetical protein
MTDHSTLEPALSHAWRYFELHANQRIKVFNYFVALTSLVFAGLAASIQGRPRLGLLGFVLGLFLMLYHLSFGSWISAYPFS